MSMGRAVAVLILAATTLVSGCGGGSDSETAGGGTGGGAGGGTGGGSTPPFVTEIQVDPKVAVAATKMISNVASPSGAVPLGSSVETPESSPTGQTILVATDAAGKTILAAIQSVRTTSTTLSAESSALAFARLAIGAAETPGQAAAQDAAILAAAKYPSLVVAIANAVAAETPPLDNQLVLEALADVAEEVVAVPTATVSSKVISAAAVINPIPLESIPYLIVNNSIGAYYSGISLARVGKGNATLKNDMAIPWSITVITNNGNSPTYEQVIAASQEATFSTTGSTSGFNLHVDQNTKTNSLITDSIIDKLLGTLLSFADPSGCANTTIKAALTLRLGGNPFSSLTAFLSALESSADALKECGAGMPRLFATAIVGILNPLKNLQRAWDIASLMGLVRTAETYWSVTGHVGVCLTQTGSVTTCPARIEFGRSNFVLAPGATVQPNAEVVDENGFPSNANASIEYSSSTPVIATVDPVTGAIGAKLTAPDPIEIAATDPWSGAVGSMHFRVLEPAVMPLQTTLYVAGTNNSVVLTITDPNGGPIIMPQHSVLWLPDDIGGTHLRLVSNGREGDLVYSVWYVPPTAMPGTVTITAYDSTMGRNIGEPVVVEVKNLTPVATTYKIAAVQGGIYGGIQPPLIGQSAGNVQRTTVTANSHGTGGTTNSTAYVGLGIFVDGGSQLVAYSPTICFANGSWVPRQYNYRVHSVVPASGSCSGSFESTFDGSATVDAQGGVTVTFNRTLDNRSVCTQPGGTTTTTHVNTMNQNYTIAIPDGHGSFEGYISNRWDQHSVSGQGNSSAWNSFTITDTAQWPAESATPPVLAGLHMKAVKSYFEGDVLPAECAGQ